MSDQGGKTREENQQERTELMEYLLAPVLSNFSTLGRHLWSAQLARYQDVGEDTNSIASTSGWFSAKDVFT